MNTQAMFQTHPQTTAGDTAAFVAAIDAASECAQVCSACADACLAEEMVAELRHCVRLNLDCADICATTVRILSRQTQPDTALLRAQLEACVLACQRCKGECEKHAEMHEHCRVCAESCRRCEAACAQLRSSLAS